MSSGKPMTIHSGIRFVGGDPNLVNLQLEELAVDPENPQTSRVWLNTAAQLVKVVTGLKDDGSPDVVYLLTEKDLQQLNQALDGKANSGTTLAEYGITDAISDTDPRIMDPHVKYVSEHAGEGQFTTIKEALESVSNATATHPYLIRVSPGRYVEEQLVMKPYVFIEGAGDEATIIESKNPNEDLVIATPHSGITRALITGATGAGKALVKMDDAVASLSQVFVLSQVKLGAADTLVQTNGGFIVVVGSTIGETRSFRQGFVVLSDGNRFARIALRNTSSNGMAAPYPESLFKVKGTKAQLLLTGVMMRGATSTSNLLDGSSTMDPKVGIRMADGARVRAVGSSISGLSYAILVENDGAGPILECQGVNLVNNVDDIRIDHPGTTGAFQGTASRDLVYVNPDTTDLTITYADLMGNGLVNAGPLFIGNTHQRVTDIVPLISRGIQTGLMDGGVLTRGPGLYVLISAGSGYIMIDGELASVKWDSGGIAVDPNSSQYIYIDRDGYYKTSIAEPKGSENVVLGRTLTGPLDIILLGSQGRLKIDEFNPNLDKLLRQAVGPLYVSGSIVSETPGLPRRIDVTAGHYFYSTTERRPAAATATPMLAGFHYNGAPAIDLWQSVNNTIYDNGTTLVALSPGYYTKHRLFSNTDGISTTYMVAVGQAQYATLQEAIDAPLTPAIFSPDGTPQIAAIIVQQGNPNIVEIIDIRPRIGFTGATSSGVSDHGDLTGLEGDDHPQYMRTDGTRTMVGPLKMGGQPIENVTTINGVDIAAQASRHLPNGGDPLATSAPTTVLTPTTKNTVGTANSFARGDHTHEITGFQVSSAVLDAVAAISGTGIVRRVAGLWSASGLAAGDIPTLDWSKIGTGKPTTLTGYGITDAVNVNKLGVANGVATLGADGKLTTAQIPESLLGGMNYQGTWNASTNSPTLQNGVGTKGHYYKVATPGNVTVDGNSGWQLGDLIVFNGTAWDRIEGGPTEVSTVAGRVGNVVLTAADIGGLVASATTDTTNANNIATGTLSVARTPSYSGDVTKPAGGGTLTLANTAVVAGNYGSGTLVGTFTVDSKGRIVAAGNVAIAPPWTAITGKPNTVAGYGITDAITAQNPTFTGVLGMTVPGGQTTEREATPVPGRMRFNTTTAKFEGYTGNTDGWQDLTNALVALYTGNLGAISGTSTISFDNSAPGPTEGSQLFSQTITPKTNTPRFVIDFTAMCDTGTSGRAVTLTVWRGTTFIGYTTCYITTTARPQQISVRIVDDLPAGTTSVTYSVRCGISSSGTWYLGRASTITMGGANRLSWTIAEVAI